MSLFNKQYREEKLLWIEGTLAAGTAMRIPASPGTDAGLVRNLYGIQLDVYT